MPRSPVDPDVYVTPVNISARFPSPISESTTLQKQHYSTPVNINLFKYRRVNGKFEFKRTRDDYSNKLMHIQPTFLVSMNKLPFPIETKPSNLFFQLNEGNFDSLFDGLRCNPKRHLKAVS